MDGQGKYHLEKQKQKFFTNSIRSSIKKQAIFANISLQSLSHMNDIISILTKDSMFRSKDEQSIVAFALRQTQFYSFYEKEFTEIPSALRMLVSGMTYEQFLPCQKIYTEKEKARKVYIILQGEACLYSQNLRKDRFKILNQLKQMKEGKEKEMKQDFQNAKDSISDNLNENEEDNSKTDKLLLEKMFASHYSQFKTFASLKQFDFFGDIDVRHKSKYTLSAVAKTHLHCAVIPCDLFSNYLGESSQLFSEVAEMQKCNLFKFLDPQYVEHCLRYSQQVVYSIGSVIFKEGEKSGEVYYIKEGEIEQSIRPIKKQDEKQQKLKEISVDLKDLNQDQYDDEDGFDTEKFLKSTLFNQTLYEKGGPVKKSRQFWNQGNNGQDQQLVEKIMQEIDQSKILLQKQGIKHSKIEIEDQVKEFMVKSTSKKFEAKNNKNNSFLKNATNDISSSGLKLSLQSVGSYFGEEVISSHSIFSSPSSSTSKRDIFDNHNNNNLENNNETQQGNKSQSNFLRYRNSFREGKGMIDSKQNKDHPFFQEKDDFLDEKAQFRKYTVKCNSASCTLLKISMEIFLSFICLNQKEMAAQIFLQTHSKEDRRANKIETHVRLINTSKLVQPNDPMKQKHKSIFQDKILEIIQGNTSDNSSNSIDFNNPKSESSEKNRTISYSEKSRLEESSPFYYNNVKSPMSQASSPRSNISKSNKMLINPLNFNEGDIQIKEQQKLDYILNSPQITCIQSPNNKQQDLSLDKNSQKYNDKTKNSIFYNNQLNPQQTNGNHLQNNKISIDLNRKKGLKLNYGNTEQDISIHSPSASTVGFNKNTYKLKSQKSKEMSDFAQTLQCFIQQEETRQRQISLMTNTLEKQYKPTAISLQDTHKNSPLISPNLSNRFFGDGSKESIYALQQNSPKSSGKQKNYFFRPSYSELKPQTDQNQMIKEQQPHSIDKKMHQQYYSNYSNHFENIGEEVFNHHNQNNSKVSITPSIQEMKKSQIQGLSELNNINTSISLGSHRNSFSKIQSQSPQQLSYLLPQNQQPIHPLGYNLTLGTSNNNSNNSNPTNLLKEYNNKSNSHQNIIQYLMKNYDNQQSPQYNFTNAVNNSTPQKLDLDLDKKFQFPSQQKNESKISKNNSIVKDNDNIINKKQLFGDFKLQSEQEQQDEDLQKSNIQLKKKISSTRSDITSYSIPSSYILKPLLNEIIQSEREKKEKDSMSSSSSFQKERVNIQIFGDFYIKKYRKAYKEACNQTLNQLKPSFQSIFNNKGAITDKKQKLSEEEMSLIFLKKHQIDKKFPNSDRAKQINEFFNKQVQQIDDYHKDEIRKVKHQKDISSPNEILRQISQQNRIIEKQKEFAGRNFNFIVKDQISNSSPKSNKNSQKIKFNQSDLLNLK